MKKSLLTVIGEIERVIRETIGRADSCSCSAQAALAHYINTGSGSARRAAQREFADAGMPGEMLDRVLALADKAWSIVSANGVEKAELAQLAVWELVYAWVKLNDFTVNHAGRAAATRRASDAEGLTGSSVPVEVTVPTDGDASSKKYRAIARELAAAHRQWDPQTAEIYLFPDAQLADVRLLEVSSAAPCSGDVFPFHFPARPDLGIDLSSTVVLLNPEEWKEVLAGKLSLPDGWDLTKKEPLQGRL